GTLPAPLASAALHPRPQACMTLLEIPGERVGEAHRRHRLRCCDDAEDDGGAEAFECPPEPLAIGGGRQAAAAVGRAEGCSQTRAQLSHLRHAQRRSRERWETRRLFPTTRRMFPRFRPLRTTRTSRPSTR